MHDRYSCDDLLTPPAAAADPHLLDTDFGGRLSESREKHLAWCGWCQQRFTQAMADYDQADEEAFIAAARKRAISEDGAALRKLTTVRPDLHLLTVSQGSDADVEVGQLWRLRWHDTAETALVVALDRWWVTVAPVTTDISTADEYSVILPAIATVFHVPAAVCFSLECVVPLFTFDQLISRPGSPALAVRELSEQMSAPETLHDVWRAWRRGTTPPQQLTYGQPLLDGDLDRRELRSALAAEFMPLVEASAMVPGESARQSSASLREMLEHLQVPWGVLAWRTGLKPEVFQRVAHGGRITVGEADMLARALDTDADTILAANPPLDEELVIEVSRPRWRSHLRRLACLRHTTEDDERLRLADTAAAQAGRKTDNQPRPLQAAETTANQPGPPWSQIVAGQLQEELTALEDCAEPTWQGSR